MESRIIYTPAPSAENCKGFGKKRPVGLNGHLPIVKSKFVPENTL